MDPSGGVIGGFHLEIIDYKDVIVWNGSIFLLHPYSIFYCLLDLRLCDNLQFSYPPISFQRQLRLF